MANVYGTAGDDLDADKVKGTELGDQLFGLAGDDELAAYAHDDWLEGGPGADYLDGGTGFDFAQYLSSAKGIKVDLAAGTFTGGDMTGDSFISIEGFLGSTKKDEMRGDEGSNVLWGWGGDDRIWGGGGYDWLTGWTGRDMIEGGGGQDNLFGGEGADSYVYRAVSDSPVGGHDSVQFGAGDRIDLSAIDAKAGKAGNQSFTFIGEKEFTGEGQIRWTQNGFEAFVEVNTQGTDDPEMVIRAHDPDPIKGADFIL